MKLGFPMSKKELQNWLSQNRGFQKQYCRLLINSVSSQFVGLIPNDIDETILHNWGYLLFSASILAQSDSGNHQDMALRIAQFCLECNYTSEVEKDAAAVVLDTLVNGMSIKLAEFRKLLQKNYTARLPLPLFKDWTRRSIKNTVLVSNTTCLDVNKFQSRFWHKVNNNDWLSMSAPTSAGKSFIVGHWLSDYIYSNPHAKIVYLVPTRALIQQVQQDIESFLALNGISMVTVTTLPMRSSIVEEHANIFVFTQERFHILLGESDSNIPFDILIVDEAQKVGDGNRGVLLQQAIESAICENSKCKVLFISPMTENPEIFLEDAPANSVNSSLLSDDIMVNQNLIWVTQMLGLPKQWDVELIINKAPVKIGSIKLPTSPSCASQRLSYVAYALGNSKGGNVIYVNGAADAEKVAKQLYDVVGVAADCSLDNEIADLIDLIKKTIHPKYSLWNVLNRGIAFHYGNMPLLIRTEIEKLFKSNKIKYLVCTSTLIEGVNMPCQSIFVRGPTKGRGKTMSHSDFWNLAGRAGRWGKEFQGNVVCVDAKRVDVWKHGTPKQRTKYRISRTADEVLNQSADILSFIEKKAPRDIAAEKPNLEYVYSYLMSSYLRNKSISNTTLVHRFSRDFIQSIDQMLADTIQELKISRDIILRSPGISPVAMNNLLEYFNKRTLIDKKQVEELIPVPSESDDAVDSYTKIFYRINNYLGNNVFGFSGRVRQLALLIVNWMNGYPLRRIIASREQYYLNKNGKIELSKLIRETMTDVETYARFIAPKYLTCYIDVLRLHLKSIARIDLLSQLKELNILLEFGVSQTTQLSLMGLGLSRSSTIIISEFITKDSLDKPSCLEWLKENDWITNDMPDIVKREVLNLIQKK